MANTPKLSTQITKEKKIFSLVPGRLSLRPKRTRTVQLGDGSFSAIDEPPVYIETLGERRNGMTTRPYDPSVPADAEVIRLVHDLLEQKPWMGTDVRYQIQILGEHEARMPWPGYDLQSADQIKATYENLPEQARPNLAEVMKYELSRVEWDDEADEEVSVTDEEKVKVLNDLYRIEEKAIKTASTDTVDLK